MAEPITDQNTISKAWKLIYDVLNDNLTDPESRNKKWIFGAFPADRIDKIGYPVIVISYINTSGFSLRAIGNTSQFIALRATINVFSTKGQQLQDLVDDVDYILTNSKHSTLTKNKCKNIRQTSFSARAIMIGRRPVHVGTITYEFEYKRG